MIVTYITIKRGTNTMRILTNPGSATGGQAGVIVIEDGITGLFESGQNNDTSIAKSYSNGSVINPTPTYSGKDVTLTIAFYGNDSSGVRTAYSNFVNTYLKANTQPLELGSSLGQTYKATLVRYAPEIPPKSDAIYLEMVFATEEAF